MTKTPAGSAAALFGLGLFAFPTTMTAEAPNDDASATHK
jgi:hypothetical protein